MTNQAPYRILIVCTGNICRSPMGERLLQAGFDSLAPGEFEVSSAGTAALQGHGIEPRVAGFINVFGANSDGFCSRQLTEEILLGKDLVLTMTRAHRSQVLQIAPGMLLRTLTVREFARLLPAVEGDVHATAAERWRTALPKALRLRTARTSDPAGDDVTDPFRLEDAVYQQMVRELVPAVRSILVWEAQYR